jgi:hypothetical protein
MNSVRNSRLLRQSQCQEWRPLINEGDINLNFRFIGRELEITGNLIVKTTFDRVIEVICEPNERKKWDLKLKDCIRLPNSNDYILFYTAGRKVFEFHSQMTIVRDENSASIEFKPGNFEVRQPSAILASFNSIYKFEIIDEVPSMTSSADLYGNTLKNAKVHWNVKFCEKGFEIAREDVFQEANGLKNSCKKLISVLEYKHEEILNDSSPLFEQYERKKLTKASSLQKF